MTDQLKKDYPWTKSPLVACGPMRLIALADLATEVSRAGGLGFIGAGNDASTLESELLKVQQLVPTAQTLKDAHASTGTLPIGIGFLLWAGESLLTTALPLLAKYKPAAVWLFAPSSPDQLSQWTREIRRATANQTKIWIQIGTVFEATSLTQSCSPDVLVVQGQDAGGHGLQHNSSLIPLLPEITDALSTLPPSKKPVLIATGGIMDGRGAAAALALGASGLVLGTRYLTAPEANIAQGYRSAILTATDGGTTTARGKLYDTLRGTRDWPQEYGGRGVLNQTWHDHESGMSLEENQKLYEAAAAAAATAVPHGDGGNDDDGRGWGEQGRLTTYAGAGVGLAKQVKSAARITEEVREDAKRILKAASSAFV